MMAARTAAPSSLSRATWSRLIVAGEAALANSSPFDVTLAVSVDIERGDLVFAVDIRQGLDRRPETADPGAGQVANREALLDERRTTLEVDAVVDGDPQVGGIDLGALGG